MADKPNSARPNDRRHGPADLHISGALLSDEALRFIIDEWLIPCLLEEFLRTKILRTRAEQEHNGEPASPNADPLTEFW
jgi:hypothetical protein